MKLMITIINYLCYGLLLLIVPWLLTRWYYQPAILPLAALSAAPTAIVFGAGLGGKDIPSAVLSERIQAAVELYHAGKVKNILLSGDGLHEFHNEPAAMRSFALKLGVPTDALVLDYAGNDTYNTCLNAKAIFDIERAILVTQRFHLPRALFICNNLGVISTGIAFMPRKRTSRVQLYREVREMLATFVAWIEIGGNSISRSIDK